jgi:serine/threonine protein kinase
MSLPRSQDTPSLPQWSPASSPWTRYTWWYVRRRPTRQASLTAQLDYCPGGEVFSYLRRARRFNEPTSQFYAAEIVLILEFLHEREGVAYRDLKPENILIDSEGHLKLVDFGFAKKVENSESSLLGLGRRY